MHPNEGRLNVSGSNPEEYLEISVEAFYRSEEPKTPLLFMVFR